VPAAQRELINTEHPHQAITEADLAPAEAEEESAEQPVPAAE